MVSSIIDRVEGYRPSCGWTVSERRRATWKVGLIGWPLMPVCSVAPPQSPDGRRRCSPNTRRGSWRGPLQRRARQFVLGEKDKHSWPPRPSLGGMLHAPQRLHHRPLGPPPQIPSHQRVPPAWSSARILQPCNSFRQAPSLQTVGLYCRRWGMASPTKKVSWKNQTIPSLSCSEKPVMAIVTVLVVVTVSQSFRNQTGYRMQGSSLQGSLLIFAKVAKTVTSLLRRFGPFLARYICPHNDLSCHSWNRWYDSGPCKPHR